MRKRRKKIWRRWKKRTKDGKVTEEKGREEGVGFITCRSVAVRWVVGGRHLWHAVGVCVLLGPLCLFWTAGVTKELWAGVHRGTEDAPSVDCVYC